MLVDPRGAEVEIPIDYRSTRPERTQSTVAFLEGEGISTRNFLGLRPKLPFSQMLLTPGAPVAARGRAPVGVRGRVP